MANVRLHWILVGAVLFRCKSTDEFALDALWNEYSYKTGWLGRGAVFGKGEILIISKGENCLSENQKSRKSDVSVTSRQKTTACVCGLWRV